DPCGSVVRRITSEPLGFVGRGDHRQAPVGSCQAYHQRATGVCSRRTDRFSAFALKCCVG
ncbi:MAG: hypothetical protein ACUVSZ_05505, partial [Chloroflexus sp.]|uniref:hypothetical protein n=1 Tax=Chloroflexus sp. TaxID=1904827 RepID=UPI0040491402